MMKKNACSILCKNRKTLGRLEDNIKITFYVREIGCEDVNWIELAQNTVQLQAVMASGFIMAKKFLTC
jgi:hypothetical protein